LINFLLNAELREYVVILDAVEEFADAPERVSFDVFQLYVCAAFTSLA